jgi:NADH:ubiquinone oxidoreductase subunit 6 (subunit J)
MSLFDELIIYFFMFIAIALCVATVYFQNPINAVLSFIGVFIITACFLLYIGVEFLAIVYLLVYIGAVAVLFLFIVMLLNAYTRYTPFQLNAFVVILCLPFLHLLVNTYKHFKIDLIANFFNKSVGPLDVVKLDLAVSHNDSSDVLKKYFSSKSSTVELKPQFIEEISNLNTTSHL